MNDVIGEIEFAIRAYVVSTEHLIEILNRHDEPVPPGVHAALLLLANAIGEAWD